MSLLDPLALLGAAAAFNPWQAWLRLADPFGLWRQACCHAGRSLGAPMIRHIVLFSARDAADLPLIRAALSRLAEIPEALRLEVAPNARRDSLSAEIDLVVYGEFADFAALDRFKAHPIYAESVAVVRPRREIRIAVDVEAGG